jgi:hypothetical protein
MLSVSVYTEYTDPRRDEWQTKTLPALKKAALRILVEKSGVSRRALMDARAGRSRPHRKNREMLATILRKVDPRFSSKPSGESLRIDAPGSNVSSTILRFSATERRRRSKALLTTTRSEVSIYPPKWTLP